MEQSATYQSHSEATSSMEAPPENRYVSEGPTYLSGQGEESNAAHLSDDTYARLQNQWHAIHADYYNITDSGSLPLASLVVLTDREKHAVRAELHIYEEQDEHVYDLAIQRSQQVLGQQYFGDETVPLRILQSFHVHEEIDVPVQVHMPLLAKPTRNLQPLVIGAAGVVLVLGLVWGLIRLLSPTTPAESVDAGAVDTQLVEDAEGVPFSADAISPEQIAFTETDALPASRNANNQIAKDQRVRILPNFRLTLRSEAGATAGNDVGFMENGQEATVIGGPKQTQGNSDTIVWWYVRLDNGQEAWAAANTSEYMLLEPIPEQ